MHAQQAKSHAQLKTKAKSDYDSLFDGDEVGGDGFMIIDGQKIKNDGVKKPGPDVTFDEKPKVEIKSNVFPVKENNADKITQTAVVQKQDENAKSDSTPANSTKLVGTPNQAVASDATTVA